MNIKKIMKSILLIIVGGFVMYWGVSVLKLEILTLRYGKEFIGLERQTNMLGPATNLKILNYSEKMATVYFREKLGGNVLEFHKENNNWVLNRWVCTVWSKQGSAEDFIWPYIR